jgi:predicted nucleotide-binding protein
MAKRKSDIRKNIPVPNLIIPRSDAENKIYGRIALGKKLLGLSIRDEKDLEAAKAQRKKWNDGNETLLRGVFDSEGVFIDYYRSSLPDTLLMKTSWRQRISSFYESISNKITTLESIVERLELIPEKVIVSETEPSDAVDVFHDRDGKTVEPIVERPELIPEEVIISKDQESHKPVKSDTVFIIHGHDEDAKISVAEFVEKLGLEAAIFHEQLDAGQTITEQFERNTAISGYAVVILTQDDISALDDPNDANSRTRQNVMFELGYFCGVFGRARVSVLLREVSEVPIDFFDIASIPMDSDGAWQFSLAKNMKSAGLSFDANRIFY